MKKENVKFFKKGLKDGIPICMGYFAVAFALGIAAKKVGMNEIQAGLMSLGMVASAGEFAAITLINARASIPEMIITTVIVNLRYFLMGCALSQKLGEKAKLFHRLGVSYCITDEIFGISTMVDGNLNPFYSYGAAMCAIPGWTIGTVLGVWVGNILPGWFVNSLVVAVYGMFLAIVIPVSKKDSFIGKVVIISMLLSALFMVVPVLKEISSGFKVIILTIIVAGTAAYIKPLENFEKENVNA